MAGGGENAVSARGLTTAGSVQYRLVKRIKRALTFEEVGNASLNTNNVWSTIGE